MTGLQWDVSVTWDNNTRSDIGRGHTLKGAAAFLLQWLQGKEDPPGEALRQLSEVLEGPSYVALRVWWFGWRDPYDEDHWREATLTLPATWWAPRARNYARDMIEVPSHIRMDANRGEIIRVIQGEEP